MEVWKLEVDFGEYQSFQLVNKDKNFLSEFKNKILSGKTLDGEFDYIEVEIIEGNKFTDFPKFWSASGTIELSERAKKCLEYDLKDCVEFIPIRFKNSILYIVNILCLIEGINYEKATLRKLNTGLVVGLDNYAFLEDKIQGINMFKVMLNNRIYSTEVFVSSEIKAKVEKNKLLGCHFVKVWDSKCECANHTYI